MIRNGGSRVRGLGALLMLTSWGAGCGGDPASDVPDSVTTSELSFDNISGTTSPYLYDAGSTCSQYAFPSMHCCPQNMVMTGAHIGQNKWKCALLSGGIQSQNVYFDGNLSYTKRNAMHACRPGFVMIGYYHGDGGMGPWGEYLGCAIPNPGVTGEYVDTGTKDTYPMHVCREVDSNNNRIVNPGRYAMSGINVGSNTFTCAQ
jgi:hypothetical protein